jgi:DNA-binding GntR family transcriptional regulator
MTSDAAAKEGEIRVLRPTKTLRELTLQKMREAILSFHFQPGERLVERDLCAQLGVSRTIVREVLRHLESEGLVSILPNRGPIVAETSAEEAMQIYEIRAALEAMAARACAEIGDRRFLPELEAALEEIREGYGEGSSNRVLAGTTEFYRVLFLSSGREMAWVIVNSLTVRINQLRSLTIASQGRRLAGPREMEAMIEAIRSRDGTAAERAARTHVDEAARIARAILEDRQNRSE